MPRQRVRVGCALRDRLDDGRPAREVQVRAPSPRLYGARSAERLAEQVEELRVKLNGALRENRRLKEVIAEKDQRLRRLLDDFERIRKAGRGAEGLEGSVS